ncbi:MAG TPA: DNA recombination protein RmuC [Solirubrobacteraceae bacterium]|nr:DNA recombination protein RmuC [Solirubrobacteraceae bacterium]
MSLPPLILGLVLGLLAALAGAAVLAGRRKGANDETARERELEHERLRDEIKALSVDVLAQTGDALAQRLVDARRAEEERSAGEMARRAEEMKGLVGPVQERLGRMESEIGRLERERRQAQGELAAMVRQLHEGVGGLRQETGNLVSALKRPSTRGSWGEIQLRNAIEMAGMVAHCDFQEQSTIDTGEGLLRPDVLVRLPGGKTIVVDAKVPLDAYLAALEADDERERERQLARHARQTREHIAKLAAKGYQHQLENSPELVVMFVPSDGIYQAALAEDPALIEYGAGQQVLMATPTTLIGLLRAVHHGWRQELIAESAREIADSARELHKRLGPFAEHFAQIGRRLDSAIGAYNEAVGSFDHRVMPQLRQIERAGAGSERVIATPAPVEASVRQITARPRDEEEQRDRGATREGRTEAPLRSAEQAAQRGENMPEEPRAVPAFGRSTRAA